MEIEKAQELGLCFGVRRAVKLLKDAANTYGAIETLGPVAHNQQLVEELSEAGIKMVNALDQVQGKILAIPTHGISPDMLGKIKACHIEIIDTTCPIVRKAQNAAKKLAQNGFDVIVFGEAEHSEVKGLLGWAGAKGIAALESKQVVTAAATKQALLTYRLGIISQTTQSQPAFAEFATQLMAVFVSKLKEMRVVNTLCQATQRRQQAAMELARRSDLVIVVGGHDSANTKHLAELCSPMVETHLVERAKEIDSSWLLGKHHVGITAGASTPDEAVDEVIAKLRSL
jgi:4-hydroxy-3-methylbut-2-enyl diphosphate reductase